MLVRTGLGVRDYPPCLSMAAHEHDSVSFSIVVGGDFLERIGGRERHYARGHVALFPAGMTHSQVFGPPGARQIIFRPETGWLDYLADCGLRDAPCGHAPAFQHLGERLLEEIGNDDRFSQLACEGLLLEIVGTFGRSGIAETARGRPPAWLCMARDFLHETACRSPGLAEIARAAGRHEIHLAREFRRHFGMSIGEYLRLLKTEQAARLLAAGRTGISEIALDCGFANHSHLCRAFRAQHGITPSQYRARHGSARSP
ncbi:MAG TPA: AraC family transcriptional regulator [Rhizomicrobium sp.]|jgi:AraC family transcriptional regulator